jgi:hypothetical protein
LDGFDFHESSSDFVVGKDRELLHASIDLKWIFDCLVQKETWINILNTLQEKIHRIHQDYDNECTYREQAEKIMSEIYDVNPAEFQLRVFRQSLRSAQEISYSSSRLILFYCEEITKEVIPSLETFLFRRALSSKRMGNFINDNFIFMTAYENHPYVKDFLRSINKDSDRPPLQAPFVLALHSGISPLWNTSDSKAILPKTLFPIEFLGLKLPNIRALLRKMKLNISDAFEMKEGHRQNDSAFFDYLQQILTNQNSLELDPKVYLPTFHRKYLDENKDDEPNLSTSNLFHDDRL